MRYIKVLTEEDFNAVSALINEQEGYPYTDVNGLVIKSYLNKDRLYHPVYGYYINKDAVTDKYIEDFSEAPPDFFDTEYTFDFLLGNSSVNKITLHKNLSYLKRETRNLNTAVDVYFLFDSKTYGIRFSDWNIFNVLSDQECEEKLRAYITSNSKIEHPAAPL